MFFSGTSTNPFLFLVWRGKESDYVCLSFHSGDFHQFLCGNWERNWEKILKGIQTAIKTGLRKKRSLLLKRAVKPYNK